MAYFTQTAHDLSPKGYGRIKSITVRVCVTDCTGVVHITDMLLQGGSIAVSYTHLDVYKRQLLRRANK